MRDDTVGRGLDLRQVAGVHAGQQGPVRCRDVHRPAGGDVLLERPARLLLDVRPGGIVDRSELAVQVVHGLLLLFRLPMPSDPWSAGAGLPDVSSPDVSPAGSGPGGSGRSSRKSADGAKNRLPVTAVEKSRMRSVLPGGLPINMLTSICSVTPGMAA